MSDNIGDIQKHILALKEKLKNAEAIQANLLNVLQGDTHLNLPAEKTTKEVANAVAFLLLEHQTNLNEALKLYEGMVNLLETKRSLLEPKG